VKHGLSQIGKYVLRSHYSSKEFDEEVGEFTSDEDRGVGEKHLTLINGFVNLIVDPPEATPQVPKEVE